MSWDEMVVCTVKRNSGASRYWHRHIDLDIYIFIYMSISIIMIICI